MRITVYSRRIASTLPPDPSKVLISIYSPGRDYWNTVNLIGWKDVLELGFHDVGNPKLNGVPNLISFNEVIAEQLHSFIVKHYGSNFVVHCDAGVSRSVAVAAYMRDYLGYNAYFRGDAKDDSHKNVIVYNTMATLVGGYNERS